MPSTQRLLAPGLLVLLVGSAVVSSAACNSSEPSNASGAAGAPDSSGSGGGDGPSGSGSSGAGSSDSAAGAGDKGPFGDAGGQGEGGALGDAGAPGAASAALPETTFLYVYSETADHDVLIAWDYLTGKQRVVTDLRGDGSDGWEIWGHTISPDRRRIALASLYGPTDADVATKLATRAVWSLATDGSDFTRLTPVFPNTGAGRTNFNISVQDPVFTADGSGIIYDFGNWWYEGTKLQGGSSPWLVSTSGDVPELLPASSGCSVIDPSVNPATGEVLLIHSVCVNAADEGIFLYPSAGGTEPVKLVDRGFGPGAVDPSLERASWLADGSGFVFVGSIEVPDGDEINTLSSLLFFDMASKDITVLAVPEPSEYIRNAAVAPDGSGVVYCLNHRDGTRLDLYALDLTANPPETIELTTDGKSCNPVF